MARAKLAPALTSVNDAELHEAIEDESVLPESVDAALLDEALQDDLDDEEEVSFERDAVVTPLDHAARLRRTLIVVATSDVDRRKPANDTGEDPALSEELEFVTDHAGDPPFDPPEDMEEMLLVTEAADEDPPFDPPELEEGFIIAMPADEEAEERAHAADDYRVGQTRPDTSGDAQLPVPPISIFASWDRAETGELLAAVAADRRLARAEVAIQRGGFDGALVHLQAHAPDLLIVDSTLRVGNLLACVERMKSAMARGVKLIILGAVNDVGLFRELAQRGVSEYILTPAAPEAIAGAICRLYADADKSRVIAVIGARGGIGASTVAHNVAWSIAERQGIGTTLVDLDLPFGAAALSFRVQTLRTLGDALEADDAASHAALEEVVAKRTERLQVLTAPASVQRELGFDAGALEKVISGARRMSSFVVLDLPHQWSSWVKQALLQADEVVIVASPDLASLRNADNMLKLLRDARRDWSPLIVLSMVGVPKRPEIPLKEFAEALDTTPAMSLAFEPALFGEATMSGKMLAELDERSKAALSFDELASALTGRAPFEAPRPASRTPAPLELAQVLVEPPRAPDDPFELTDAFADGAQAHAMEANDEGDALEADVSAAEPDKSATPRAFDPIIIVPAPALDDYIERARKSAHVEAFRLEEEDEFVPPPQQLSFGWHRLFALATTVFAVIVLGGAWLMESRTPASVEPRAAAAAVSPAQTTSAPAVPSQRYLAAIDLLDGDPVSAARLMQQAADAGYPLAQYHLGQLYEHGEGVAANIATARVWTERAANAGNVRAMHDLGVYNAMGDAAPMDQPTAFRWFQQAAEFGLADSQYNLGILYEQGRGVGADAGEALFWYMLAAAQGDDSATERATALQAQLTAMDLEQAQLRVASFEARTPDPYANDEPSPLVVSPQSVQATPASEQEVERTAAPRSHRPPRQRDYSVNVAPLNDETPR